jgi:hypothetical protein
MFAAMDLGVTDYGERAGHEQAAQMAVTLLADIAEPVLASARVTAPELPESLILLTQPLAASGSIQPSPTGTASFLQVGHPWGL